MRKKCPSWRLIPARRERAPFFYIQHDPTSIQAAFPEQEVNQEQYLLSTEYPVFHHRRGQYFYTADFHH
jgi:hypothetical protein